MKKFEISYKNGNKLIKKAHSIELHDGRYYVAGQQPFGSNSTEWYSFSAENIISVKELN